MRTKHNLNSGKSLFEVSKDTKIRHFLKAVPYLDFTPTGLTNIAKRFSITVSELQEHIDKYQAKEDRTNG